MAPVEDAWQVPCARPAFVERRPLEVKGWSGAIPAATTSGVLDRYQARVPKGTAGGESAKTSAMRIITETADLKAFVAELERGPFAAIDTEFMRDQTYWPKLCLIQAAGPEAAAIIDPLAKDIDLAPLYQLHGATRR